MAYTTIDNPLQYFNTVTYTGNGGSQSVQGVGFQPDLVWLKSRTLGQSHFWSDVIRGAGQVLISNNTDAEQDFSANFTAFSSDGYTLANGTNGFNASSETYVSWNWLAGGSASSNSDGSVTSNVSANTTAGFSIVSYTGNETAKTIGHGLGAIPQIVITKNRSTTGQWAMYNRNLGANKNLHLETTDASASSSAVFNDTESTSSVFSVGSAVMTNDNGSNFIAYCFAEKKGYSKFGSYPGNGNADGPFIYTGFKPAWLMVKGYAGTDDWIMMDNKRSGFNSENEYLDANNASTESDGSGNIDFLSNGFKIKSTFSSLNYSTGEYIYMAFAESPFVNSSGIPCNAR